MDFELIVRLLLVGLGIFFLLLSAAGAVLELARRGARLEGAKINPLEGVTRLAEALAALFSALKDAPLWLGLGGFGVILILLGALLPLPFLRGV
jgi:hypothetical protein